MVAAQIVGNDATIAWAGASGNFELNVAMPVIGRNLLESIRLLANASTVLADRTIDGITADLARMREYAESSPSVVTPLNRFIALNSWGQRLDTRYNSLQVVLNKPFTHGILFKGAYTLSKAMNESDNDGRATLNWNTPSEVWRNWAPAGFDRRHNFTLGFAYQLPWQSSGGYDGLLNAIINDWQVNGIFQIYSGQRFTVTANDDEINAQGVEQTADLVGPVVKLGHIGDPPRPGPDDVFGTEDDIAGCLVCDNPGPYFDPYAWAQPIGQRRIGGGFLRGGSGHVVGKQIGHDLQIEPKRSGCQTRRF